MAGNRGSGRTFSSTPEDAYDDVVLQVLPWLTLTLSGALLVLAGSNATFLTGPDRVITVAAGLSATVLLTGAWSLVQRWPLKPTLAHPAAAAIVLVAVAVTVIQLVVTGDPNQTTLILLLVAGSGAALLSLRWLAATLYLTWGAWGAGAVLVGHSDDWPRHVVAMTLATGFAAIINALLRRMVRELAESRAAAEAGAVRDDLTGLSNRSGLALLGAQITEHARRSGDAVHCIFVDVVGLTTVNEKLGHDAGNDVLCSVAEGLRRVTRAADVVARWEGDKFCVLGPGPGMPPVELERRLRAILLSDPFIRAGVWIPWVSAGGSVLAPWDSGTLDTLLGKADHEMFLRRALRRESPPSTPWRASAE